VNKRPAVLVVDDDEHLRTMLSEALRIRGFTPIVAEDGVRAQSVITQRVPEVVLLDLMMPNMSGWDYLDWLRTEGYLDKTKVIILTAHNEPNEEELLQKGAIVVLRKPAHLRDIFKSIDAALTAAA
jgi:CheY-like chemotaxis protein